MTDYEERRPKWSEKAPLKKMGKPKDIAYAAVLLASEKSKFTRGADWIIDGGYTC